MKITITAIILLLFINSVLILGDTASGNYRTNNQFSKWRSCLADKLPIDKKGVFDDTFSKTGGTAMSKFRRGILAVLQSYDIDVQHRFDLKKTENTANFVNSPELKKAFQNCPKDDGNAPEDRMVKCVIDNLEVNCTLPPK